MAVTNSMFRLEPLNLFQVFRGEYVFEKFKPMSNRFAVRRLDRREVRCWSLHFVGHALILKHRAPRFRAGLGNPAADGEYSLNNIARARQCDDDRTVATPPFAVTTGMLVLGNDGLDREARLGRGTRHGDSVHRH